MLIARADTGDMVGERRIVGQRGCTQAGVVAAVVVGDRLGTLVGGSSDKVAKIQFYKNVFLKLKVN